jgi:hypothetical protein
LCRARTAVKSLAMIIRGHAMRMRIGAALAASALAGCGSLFGEPPPTPPPVHVSLFAPSSPQSAASEQAAPSQTAVTTMDPPQTTITAQAPQPASDQRETFSISSFFNSPPPPTPAPIRTGW